jgi:DNA-binding CsgD family transcriptional regulator
MKNSPTFLAASLGPVEKKTFSAALDLFFQEQCPQMGGALTRKVLVSKVQELVDTFYPPHTHLRMGQVMWPAVDENETTSYGKPIEKTRLKPVFVDLIAPEDIEATLQGECRKLIRQRATVRIFNQAKEQGGVLSCADVATLMRLSLATISKYVCQWEKEHHQIVPRRGTVHDLGPSLTHKRLICYKVLVEGKSIEETARETRHSPEAITRYVKDYKRILTCLRAGLSLKETSFAVNVSEKLVYEYLNLIQENHLDSTTQAPIMDKEDDLPF